MAVTYRLKDRELQQKLDELTDGDFSKALAKTLRGDDGLSPNIPHISIDFGEWINPHASELLRFHRFRVYFRKDEIETIPVYDPHAWNEYPAVTPPEGIWMRLEVNFEGKKSGCMAIFSEGIWMDDWRKFDPQDKLHPSKIRFRPWDEGDTY